MAYNDNTTSGTPWVSFAIGALVGAGIALLVAPKPGSEVREILVQRGRELKDKAQEGYEKIRHRNRMGDFNEGSDYATSGSTGYGSSTSSYSSQSSGSSFGTTGTSGSGTSSDFSSGKTGKKGSNNWSNEGGRNV